VQRRCQPCDPVEGFADSCASACQDERVERRRLVTKTVVEDRPLRMHLLRVFTGVDEERLCWAVSVPEAPEGAAPDLLVDAFLGQVVPQAVASNLRGTSPIELVEDGRDAGR
jgi:hypothetical protein